MRQAEGWLLELYCREHRKEHHVNILSKKCRAEGCRKQPYFGDPVECVPIYCFVHKSEEHRDVKNRRCHHPHGCKRHPTYGDAREGVALYCLRHRFPTHVRVCLINSRRALTQADGSQARAPDSYPSDKRQFNEAQEGGKVERGDGDRVGGRGVEMQESERVKGLDIRKELCEKEGRFVCILKQSELVGSGESVRQGGIGGGAGGVAGVAGVAGAAGVGALELQQHLAMHAAAAVARADNAGICPAGSPQVCLGLRV